MRRWRSIGARYFEKMYAGNPDPWRFADSDYEREKYAATIAALPPRHFASALEVGCSIGVLTRLLAERCDMLLAIDVAETALARARDANPGVRFERRYVPAEWPPGQFDLIVLSEVLYYLAKSDFRRTVALAVDALRPGGSILAVHYLGATDYPLTGDQAAEGLITESGLRPALQVRQALYRIDRLDAPGRAMAPG